MKMPKQQRILVISTFFPFPPTNGFTLRVSALLQALRKNGASVHLVCFGQGSDLQQHTEIAHQVCDNVAVISHAISSMSQAKDYLRRFWTLASNEPHAVARFRSARMKNQISVWAKTEHFDAIICETPYMLVNVPADLKMPIVIDSHNVENNLLLRYLPLEMNSLKRSYASLEAKKMAAWERNAFSRCSAAMACSDMDATVIHRMCPSLPVFVVPNAIDTTTYHPSTSNQNSTLLYLGGMDWYPNRDAVRYFVSAIFPSIRATVPHAKFLIAGRSPSESFRELINGIPGVSFTGTLPDVRPVISTAAVVVVPLRIGSGTRFKILEAAAMGKPIVSTRLGAEGLNFKDAHEIVLADNAATFARAVVELLKYPGRCDELGCAARCRVSQEYSFAALKESTQNLLNHLQGIVTLR